MAITHRAYSKFSSPAGKLFKMMGTGKTEDDFAVFAQKSVNWSADPRLLGGVGATVFRSAEAMVEFVHRYRPMHHYYLSQGLADFLVSCVKEVSGAYFKALPECPMVDGPRAKDLTDRFFMVSQMKSSPTTKTEGGFAIHFSASEGHKSVVCIPNGKVPAYDKGQGDVYVYPCIAYTGEDILLINPIQAEKTGSGWYEKDGEGPNAPDSVTEWYHKLILGFSLYIDAFPDALAPAEDSVLHHNHYNGPKNLVRCNQIAQEDISRSVSPHWRRGHFKLLQADRFVHKRGQTVFCKGTFVKGTAEDVHDDSVQPQEKAS